MQIQCQYFWLQVAMKFVLFYSFEHPENGVFCHMHVTPNPWG